MAYIGLEPKSSHTIKYSQPFELVLFHMHNWWMMLFYEIDEQIEEHKKG